MWKRVTLGRWGIVDSPGNPDDLRNAFHQAWMRRYLNREPSSLMQERKAILDRALQIEQLEYMWSLPEREEP